VYHTPVPENKKRKRLNQVQSAARLVRIATNKAKELAAKEEKLRIAEEKRLNELAAKEEKLRIAEEKRLNHVAPKRKSRKKKSELPFTMTEQCMIDNRSENDPDDDSGSDSEVVFQGIRSPSKSPRATSSVDTEESPDSSRKRVRNGPLTK
jgi:hypothetical protein